jgi:hypothetical protein
MAVVAIHTVVDVTTNTTVLTVRFRFCMAVRALEHAVIVRVRMASSAHSICSPVIHWKVRVVESSVEPAGRRMARSARGWEARAHVIRIGRPAVVLLMATIAIGRQRRVVVVHVTASARHRCVRSRQREACVVVIKSCLGPGRRVVANVALLRKSDGWHATQAVFVKL